MQRRFKLKTIVFMFLVMLGLAVGIGSGSASETLLLKFRETYQASLLYVGSTDRVSNMITKYGDLGTWMGLDLRRIADAVDFKFRLGFEYLAYQSDYHLCFASEDDFLVIRLSAGTPDQWTFRNYGEDVHTVEQHHAAVRKSVFAHTMALTYHDGFRIEIETSLDKEQLFAMIDSIIRNWPERVKLLTADPHSVDPSELASCFSERVLAPEYVGRFQRNSVVYKNDSYGAYLESRYEDPNDQSVFILRQYDLKLYHERETFQHAGVTVWQHSYPARIWGEDRIVKIWVYELYWDQGNRHLEILGGNRRVLLDAIEILTSMGQEGAEKL